MTDVGATKSEEAATVVAVTLIITATFAAAAILDGLVVSIIWGWFVVPVFSLPSLSLPQGIGLSILVGLLAHQHVPCPPDKVGERIRFMFFHPALALSVGWIVKQWMAL